MTLLPVFEVHVLIQNYIFSDRVTHVSLPICVTGLQSCSRIFRRDCGYLTKISSTPLSLDAQNRVIRTSFTPIPEACWERTYQKGDWRAPVGHVGQHQHVYRRI